MPCMQCDDGKWKWGQTGDCEYESREECEAAHSGDEDSMMKNKNWFRMEVEKEATVADIYVFGLIGDWIDDLWSDIGLGFDSVTTARSFQTALDELPDSVKTLKLHVNSPGGDVFGAVAIANILRDQRLTKGRNVEAMVEGLAASAASLFIQAADPIRVGDNSLIMIHDPWTVAVGNSRELSKAADELDKISDEQLVPTYQWHSELDKGEIRRLMAETTWMGADEAIENGFATEKVEGLKAAAVLDRKAIKNLDIPEQYRATVESMLAKPPEPEPEPEPKPQAACATEVLRLCREGECLDLAEALIESEMTLDEAKAAIATEKELRGKAKAEGLEIRGLCEKAKLETLADSYVEARTPVGIVRHQLNLIRAAMDIIEIDGKVSPDRAIPETKTSWKEAFARVNSRYGAHRG